MLMWVSSFVEFVRELTNTPREVVVVPPRPSIPDLMSRFTYQPPSPDGVQTHAHLSDAFIDLAELVDSLCPPGREKATAFTKLEEAKFWASAAIARNPDTR